MCHSQCPLSNKKLVHNEKKLWGIMDVKVGLWRRLSAKELMLLNCGVGEDSCTARRSNQSILKEISPGISLEGMMLKLKLQYFGHLMRRVDSLEKTLMLGGTGGRRRRGWQRMRWLDSITDSMDVSLGELQSWWWTGRPGVLRFMGSQRVRHYWVTELNWTELKVTLKFFKLGFSSMWTENFQMYKPGLEKAEEPEIKLPTFIGS